MPRLLTPVAAISVVIGPVLAAAPAPTPDKAQSEQTLLILRDDPAKDAALFDFSYGAPNSPVLPLLGVQADQITKVESFRKLGLSVIGGSESSGGGKAYAIDFSPYWLLSHGATSLADYRSFSSAERMFSRAKGALAVSEGSTSKGIPSSAVFSISTKILDSQDPLEDKTFENCVVGTRQQPGELWQLVDQIEQAGQALPPPDHPELADAAFDKAVAPKARELKPAIQQAYKVCTDRVAKVFEQRSSLDAGAGLRMSGKPDKFSGFAESGTIVWVTYATGAVGGNSQNAFWRSLPSLQFRGVIHTRYTFSEETSDTKGAKTGGADAALIALGIESIPDPSGNSPIRWSLQAGWNKQVTPNSTVKAKNYGRYLFKLQTQIGDGLWLNGTLGRVSGKGVQSDTYVLVGINFALASSKTAIDDFYSKVRY